MGASAGGRLDGKVVIVTGAGGYGVGGGVAEAVQAAGALLVVNDTTADALDAAAARFPDAVLAPGDITRADDVEAIVHAGIDRHGRVDGLVNNAGIGLRTPAHLATEAEFDHLYAIDVKGLWLMTRAFVTHRIAVGGGGAIVKVSSVHGTHTQNRFGLYAGAKGAVEGLTRGFAAELGMHGIRCNAVAPGAVFDERVADRYGFDAADPVEAIHEHSATQQVLNRAVEPRDIGEVAAFLLSDAAWAVAGQTVRVDAGLSMLLYDRRSSGDHA
ncbi:SDR family NAD(P)-dependent oxidoreductase [Plantibacter sp. Mn2098]|uniref:SDR family NAD(P)-dependent oxidoreductase n=1 Tax=Plantibacter sp. Mn2098 TaxID=3395266 RepID=UPI003BBF9B69